MGIALRIAVHFIAEYEPAYELLPNTTIEEQSSASIGFAARKKYTDPGECDIIGKVYFVPRWI